MFLDGSRHFAPRPSRSGPPTQRLPMTARWLLPRSAGICLSAPSFGWLTADPTRGQPSAVIDGAEADLLRPRRRSWPPRPSRRHALERAAVRMFDGRPGLPTGMRHMQLDRVGRPLPAARSDRPVDECEHMFECTDSVGRTAISISPGSIPPDLAGFSVGRALGICPTVVTPDPAGRLARRRFEPAFPT